MSLSPICKETHEKTVLYQTRTDEAKTRTDFLFQQAVSLYDFVSKQEAFQQTEPFLHLKRLLDEQCVIKEEGVRVPISSKEVSPRSLQNPSDPDATFRIKGDTQHIGYVANLVEVRDEEKKISLILHHDVRPNTHSDAEFGETLVSEHALVHELDTLVADGANYRASTAIHAEKVNVAFHVSKMTGSSVPDDRMGVDTFEMNEETHQIVRCPAGHAPLYSEYKPEKEVYRAKFAKPDCENCPLLHRCPVEEKKEMNTLRFTETKRQADRIVPKWEVNSIKHSRIFVQV